jgi:response regulator RpfG family c-di-GMP phosphodiesterase
MMRVFILEDDFNRMDKFIRKLSCDQIDHAETVEAGKELVQKNKYDLLLLDHDLGGKQMVDSSEENTGYQLAVFISGTQNKDTPCITHTCNPAGANNILSVLPHAVKVPFPLLDISMVGEFVKHMKGV